MEEEIEIIIETTKDSMEKTIAHLEQSLLKIRAGRANPAMLEGVRVEYYGSMTPLSQVSNVNTPDARTITIQPWEKGLIPEIEKAVLNANLGLNPQNNGDVVIINIPPLTEDRRKSLVKMVRSEAEDSRIAIRNSRKEANDEIRSLEKDGLPEDMAKNLESEIQDITNAFTARIDKIVEVKEADIMTV